MSESKDRCGEYLAHRGGLNRSAGRIRPDVTFCRNLGLIYRRTFSKGPVLFLPLSCIAEEGGMGSRELA